jgi:hypothetical protein
VSFAARSLPAEEAIVSQGMKSMKRSMITAALAGAALGVAGPAYAVDQIGQTGAGAPGGRLADQSIGQAVSSGSRPLFAGTGDSLATASSVVHHVSDSLS